MNTLVQTCGALGCLKEEGVELDYNYFYKLFILICKYDGPFNVEKNATLNTMHNFYRKMCLEKGIIRIGELFNQRDCEKLFS